MDIKEIVVDGRTFEVLDLPSESDCLEFVKLPTGVICDAVYEAAGLCGENIPYDPQHDTIHITLPDGSSDELWVSSLAHYGIIPLCEIGVEPFEFVGEVWGRGSAGSAYIEVPDRYLGKKFRCVEEVS